MKIKRRIRSSLKKVKIRPRFVVFFLIAFLSISLFAYVRLAYASTICWSGGGGDNNWNTGANWKGGIAPGSGDIAEFDHTTDCPIGTYPNADKSATINVAISVAGINIKNYSGTITQGTGNTITVGSSSFNQQATGSTFLGSASTITVNGSFSLSNGAFTSTSGTMNVSGSFSLSGSGTFTHNSGTINLNDSGGNNQYISCTGSPFNIITMNQSGSYSSKVTIGSGCTVSVGSNPTLQVGAYPGTGYGLTVNGTLSGSGTLFMKGYYAPGVFYSPPLTLSCGTSTCLSGFTGVDLETANNTTSGYSIIISGSGTTLDASGYSTFKSGYGPFTLSSSGVFTAPSGSMTVKGGITINSGTTFNANGGTIVFGGTYTILTCTAPTTFNLITISSSDFTLGAGCTATLSGSHPTIPGSVTINGTLTPGTNTNLTISGGYFTVSSTGNFTAPSGIMNTAGSITIASGATFNNNSGTVNLNGSTFTDQSISCTGSPFNLVTMNRTYSETQVTIGSGCTVAVGANPTLQVGGYAYTDSGLVVNGTLSGSGTLSLKGYYSAGSFYSPRVTLSCGTSTCLSGFTGIDAETPNNTASGYTFTISGSGTSLNTTSYSTLKLGYDTLVLSSSGVFTAPSGTMTVNRGITINSGTTFNANGGTMVFAGSSSPTVTCTAPTTFNLITISANGFTLGAGCTATLSGSHPTLSSFTINGTLTPGTNTNLTMSTGTFTIGATGSFTAPSGTLNTAGSITIASGGTFIHNSGTVNLNAGSSTTQIISCIGSPFNLVTMNQNGYYGAAVTINSGCTVSVGSNPILEVGSATWAGYGLTVNGTLSGSGTLFVKGYTSLGSFTTPRLTLSCGASTCLSGFTGLDLETANNTSGGTAFVISGSGTSFDASGYSTFNVSNSTLTLSSSGVFTAPSGVWNMKGSITINSGTTFNANGGTINFYIGNQSVTCTAPTTFNLITISSGFILGSGCTATLSGSHPTISSLTVNGTLTPGTNPSLNITNSLTISSGGSFTAPPGTLNITGNLIATGGTFSPNGGTVNMNGVSTTQTISNAAFYNLIITGNVNKTIMFGGTNTVASSLTLKGAGSGSRMVVKSTSTGVQSFLNTNGPNDIEWINLRDSNACGGHALIANASTNTGNNSCWTFVNNGAKNPTYILKGVKINQGVHINGT